MRSQQLLFGLLLLLSCKEVDLNRPYPMVRTLPVSGITAEGATFSAEFSNSGTSGINDHGFVWGTDYVNLGINNSSCHSVGLGIPGSTVFHYDERSSLQNGLAYYVRGYVRANGKVVYGTMVSFRSLGSAGPSITDFSPKSGDQGERITITGSNFGQEINQVTITFTAEDNEVTVPPISVSNTSIVVKFPSTIYARTSHISIHVSGVAVAAESPFLLDGPEIESISPTNVSACDSLTIQWVDHGFILTGVAVNDLVVPFVVTGNLIKVSVKDATPSLSIKILSGLFYDIKTHTITPIGKQVLSSSFPSTIQSDDTLKIKFNFMTHCHTFRANSMGFDLTEVGRYENEVWYMPGQVPQSPQQIQVYVDNVFLALSPSMTIAFTGWARKQDFPGPNRNGAVGFTINGKGYLALGEDAGGLKNDLWEYDPNSDQWTQKAQFPGAARLFASAFVVGGKAYVGTGQTHGYGSAFKDFWQYDPLANTWTQKGDYPGGPRFAGCVTFSIGSKGYMGSGQYSTSEMTATDFWEYEPSNDTWTVKASPPTTYGSLSGFSMNSKGFGYLVYSGTAIRLLYDPVANTWDTNVANPPALGPSHYYPFAFQNEVYLLSVNGTSSNKVFRVDPVSNAWTFVQYHGGTYYDFHFVVNEKAYTGATTNLRIYEFDPSQL